MAPPLTRRGSPALTVEELVPLLYTPLAQTNVFLASGIPIANEYNYYKPDGSTDTAGSFAYWTDPIVDYDTGLAGKPVADHTTTIDMSRRRGERSVLAGPT